MYRDLKMAAAEVLRRLTNAERQMERAQGTAREARAELANAGTTLAGAGQYIADVRALVERAEAVGEEETRDLDLKLAAVRKEIVDMRAAVADLDAELDEIFLGPKKKE